MRQYMALMLAVLVGGGCGLLLDNPAPEEARVVIDGDAETEVRIITSTVFVSAVNEEGVTRVQLFEADTIVTTLPYRRTFDIQEDHRFFAEAARLDVDVQNLTMQVYLDDRKQFDEGGILIEGAPFRFVYMFNQAVTQEIEVL
ncbi:MAG TPA: hypothetical protein VMM79_16930 [Longimicrobiales bacterium]|nr:hypothetical protein [Longimicrobiales bacterium]